MKKFTDLLELSTEKYNATPFHKIKTEEFIPAIDFAIEEAKQNVQNIIDSPDEPNFSNTIEAIETSSEKLSQVLGIYYNLLSAHTNDDLQKMSAEISEKSSAFNNYIFLNDAIFKRVEAVHKNNNLTDKEEIKLLETTYKSFVRNGALLSAEDKETLKTIDKEVSSLSPKFSENVLKATNAFELLITDEKTTEGFPESLKNLAASAAEKKGKKGWLINLQFPFQYPFMKFCKDRELRKKVYMASSSRGFNSEFDNSGIIKKIVNLRLKRAQLLGYKHHADYTLEERMAKTLGGVQGLIDQLYAPAMQAAKSDIENLRKIAKELDGIDELQPWDTSYYSEIFKQKTLNFEEEKLRPYFEVDQVVGGAFKVAEKLYNIDFKEIDIPTFHKDVQTFEVSNKANGEFIGLFYVDLFPRESKRSGAWATEFKDQGLRRGKIERPHCMIVCNFTPSTNDTPSLLGLREVQTLFHEFGHALHMLLTKCKYPSLSGANVYWDFVELPSQIMENWVSEKECLNLFAKHYKTGEPIPDSYIESIKKSDQFMSGSACIRQLTFVALDLAWHSITSDFDGDIESFEKAATEKFSLLNRVDNTSLSTAFGHLFAGGYSAGYYSYKWAEVLDADAFEYFKEKGIFNQDVAKKFREEILEKGGTEHPMNLYVNFRGREPKAEALMKREGFQ